jgi:hypothetical protein
MREIEWGELADTILVFVCGFSTAASYNINHLVVRFICGFSLSFFDFHRHSAPAQQYRRRIGGTRPYFFTA